jgi:hypothetical protein
LNVPAVAARSTRSAAYVAAIGRSSAAAAGTAIIDGKCMKSC